MAQWLHWFSSHWVQVVIPLLVFLSTYVIGLWLRLLLYRFFGHWGWWSKWRGSTIIANGLRRPFMDGFLLLGAYVATQSSVLPNSAKSLAAGAIASLLVILMAWVFMEIAGKLVKTYIPDNTSWVPHHPSALVMVVIRVTAVVIGVLVILSIWGAPVNPILLVIAVLVFIAGLALRDVIPSYFISLQLSTGRQLKVGDFIRLDSGESGEVTSFSWQNTEIKSLDGNSVIIPNSKLARAIIINYGRPLKKARDPFRFQTRLHLKELTGLKACTLSELVEGLKESTESVIYFHVHHFLEEHLYLTSESANDFALWVGADLGDEILSERLASLDVFAFPNMGILKQRLVEVIEEYLKEYPDNRTCAQGEEFHFVSSISFILPTPYVAHDLGEFVEIMRKVSIDSIYFHIYESRLRLQRGTNDFSIWIADSLAEKELAVAIGDIDPYMYTLENLRLRIIEQVEKFMR